MGVCVEIGPPTAEWQFSPVSAEQGNSFYLGLTESAFPPAFVPVHPCS